MKVSLKPGEHVLPYSTYEPVISQPIFGQLKRPQDPDIRSLLTWNPSNEGVTSAKTSDKPRWLTESRDNFRGYLLTNDYQRFLRLKSDDSTTEFHPESVRVETRANVEADEAIHEAINALPEAGRTDDSAFRLTGDLTVAPNINLEIRSSRPQTAPISKRQGKALPTTVRKPQPQQPTAKSSPKKAAVLGPSSQSPTYEPTDFDSPTKRQSDPTSKKRQDERIKKMKETTRWLPDSAFTTYFGRPAFCNYGRGNVNPTYGGLMYGSYMTSHNIGPHEGDNNPKYQQVYEAAELKAVKRKPKAPEPPRKCKEEDRLNPEQVEELKSRKPVLSQPRKFPSKEIVKPDLYDAKRFKSEHNTPDTSKLHEAKPLPVEAKKASIQPTDRTNAAGRLKGSQSEANLSRTLPRAAALPSSGPTLPLSQTTKQEVLVKSPKQPAEVPAKGPPQHSTRSLQQATRPVSAAPVPQVLKPRLETLEEELPEANPLELDEAHIEEGHYDPDNCEACLNPREKLPSKRFLSTSYREMTGRATKTEPLVYEPFRYCKNCQNCLLPERPELTVEDMLRPPRHLGELPVEELNPKTYV